jgi:hypothetical protein
MWEDKATTDPKNRLSEATGGNKLEGSQTRNKQKEYGHKNEN